MCHRTCSKFMLINFIIVIAFAAYTMGLSPELQNLSASSNPEELWPIYKSDHNKNYEAEEDKERFLIFQENIKRIVEHNEKFAKGEVTFTMGINQFTDKKPEEFRAGVLPRKQ